MTPTASRTALTVPLTIKLLDLWHAGSGRGQGRSLDAVVVVDADGLPYLPGRQLRGLLRDAVRCLQAWGHAPDGTEVRLFGAEVPAADADLRLHRSQPGRLAVSSAVLPADEAAWLRSDAGSKTVPHLFVEVFSTAINTNGVAEDSTLRGIQMTVPLTLLAELELWADDPAQAQQDWQLLADAAALVQHVGAHRSRGAGRARLCLGKPE